MDDRAEVVIAGAGPAGAQCARDLASRGYDVVVLETESEDEFPRASNKSTGGTFPRMMSAFNVPDSVVMQFTDTVVLESPNEHYVEAQPGAVLEFADFKRFLVKDGQQKGAEYRFDARVSNPVIEGDEVVGVRYNGNSEIYADVVIDATGPAAPLAKKLGVSDLKRRNQAIGIEREFRGMNLDPEGYADLNDAMMLRLDHEYAPGGYAWIFHTGEDTAKVGVCFIQNDAFQRYATANLTVDGYLEHWLNTDPRFENAEPIEGKQHRGSAHIQEPGQMTTDNFIAIGDTVPTVDPMWGEGIHKGMKSARAAAVTVDHCLTPEEPDTSAENISLYNELWHSEVAPRMNARLRMTELMYLAPNDRYDTFLRDLSNMSPETMSKANEGDIRSILKLIHMSDVSLVSRFLKYRLRN